MFKKLLFTLVALLAALVIAQAQQDLPDRRPRDEDEGARKKKKCYVGGCYGRVCSTKPLQYTYNCKWDDYYYCYRYSQCAYDKETRECDWTINKEYLKCIHDIDDYRKALARGDRNARRPF